MTWKVFERMDYVQGWSDALRRIRSATNNMVTNAIANDMDRYELNNRTGVTPYYEGKVAAYTTFLHRVTEDDLTERAWNVILAERHHDMLVYCHLNEIGAR